MNYEELWHRRPELFRDGGPGSYEVLLDADDVARAEQAEARLLAGAGQPTEWARTGVVYEDQYVLLVRDAVRFPSGRLGTYIRAVAPDDSPGVAVLPLLAGDVVLIEHFRHATRQWHLEIPRGFGEPEHDAASNARKELREEIGAEATELVALGSLHPDTGFSADRVELFLARLDALGSVDGEEAIARARIISPAAVRGLIRSGELTDSFTIAAYLQAHLRGLLD